MDVDMINICVLYKNNASHFVHPFVCKFITRILLVPGGVVNLSESLLSLLELS